MEAAVQRVELALSRGEEILILGDYDVDGISSTSLLLLALRSFNARVSYLIPERTQDGYGLNSHTASRIAELKPALVITVDCGITSIDGAAILTSNGIDLVITDHHEPGDSLPDALAVINPALPGHGYPFRELAGVGVAMNLAMALAQRLGAQLPALYDLVALGTIADVMPLKGVNRIFAKLGLELMNGGARPGITALKRVADYEGKTVGAGTIGFQLAPRVNAAGRLGKGDICVRLLTTESHDEAMKIAAYLDQQNRRRQEIEEGILKEARSEVLSKYRGDSWGAYVLASSRWHQGVIGIVASRLVEEFYRPTVLISINNGMGKGSARSIPAFHLFDGLHECRSSLEEMGGHKYAAGLRIREDRIEEFRQNLNTVALQRLKPEDFIPTIKIDTAMEAEELTFELLAELQLLGPFGAANPEPVFCLHEVRAVNPRIVGKNHLKLMLQRDKNSFEAIGFKMGELAKPLSGREGREIAAAFTLQENSWNGRRSLQVHIRDIRLPGTESGI
ncbi:MAG: single-stranded-DNA-specific exonuclease RecJ [Nitrospirota bacterium]|nr:single-stranded-DNA-specific exonuclease RecJ [Nitrospirota bacterium]